MSSFARRSFRRFLFRHISVGALSFALLSFNGSAPQAQEPNKGRLAQEAPLPDTADNTEDGENIIEETPAAGTGGKRPEGRVKAQEDRLRQLMIGFGCTSRQVQDTVIAYIVQDTEARGPLRRSSGQLLQAMRTPGVTDAQISVFLNDFRNTIESEKTRRNEAQNTLRDKVGYDMTPRIEAMLYLLGLFGDSVVTLPNPNVTFQLERERNQLQKTVSNLKIDVESLRRERDTARAERDALQEETKRLKRDLEASKQAKEKPNK
jgi:hypothetical protein